MASEEESLALAEMLQNMERRLKKVEEGSRANRLSNSSLDLASGRGYIPLMEKGVERGRIGRQPDGTVAFTFANTDTPPQIPQTPVVTAGLGTLTARCNGLIGTDPPYNFSHINVYCDGILNGAINRLPGVWIVGPLTPVNHEIWFTSVDIAGKESAKSVSVIAKPNMPTERDFIANPILRTEITDGAINTPKLAANAVEAGNIAANAVRAAAIEAGSVNADKMAAQIFMTTVAFICGNPLAERLVIDSTGLNQFDDQGSFTFGIGANPNGGNFMTVIGPNGDALATIDSQGNITGQDFAADGDIILGGESLIGNLNALPRGLVGWGNNTANSAFTTGETGIMEIEVQVETNRHYRICTNTGYLEPSPINTGNAQAETRLRYTVNGSRPTVTSPILEISARATGFGEPLRIEALFDGAKATSTRRLRLLYTIAALGNINDGTPPASVRMNVPAGNAEANDLQLWVEDIGPRQSHRGVASSGGGSTTAPVADYVREFPCTWSRSYNSASAAKLYQGDAGYGNGKSLIGFDDVAIRSALSGATILSIELYLYASHWYNNSGGTVIVSTHNWGTQSNGGFNVAAYPGRNGGTYDVTRYHLNKPEGRWQGLPVSIGNQLRDNSCKGIALEAPGGLEFYGQFNQEGISGEPSLRIKYRK